MRKTTKIALILVVLAAAGGALIFLSRSRKGGPDETAASVEIKAEVRPTPSPSPSPTPQKVAHSPAGKPRKLAGIGAVDDMVGKVVQQVRSDTWKKPAYAGATRLSQEDLERGLALLKRHEQNFSKIKRLRLHDENEWFAARDTEWTRVMKKFRKEAGLRSYSLDMEAARNPLFFKMTGANEEGRKVEVLITPLGETNNRVYGRGGSWMAKYMEGFSSSFCQASLRAFGRGIRQDVPMTLSLPVLGNLSERYGVQDTRFTVIEHSVTDWWEGLPDKREIPCVESVWTNQNTGMPQFVIRERTDAVKEGEPRVVRAEVAEYACVAGVYYPKIITRIGNGYQTGERFIRTNLEVNGVRVPDGVIPGLILTDFPARAGDVRRERR